jgi:uncharacterized OB-fold protein
VLPELDLANTAFWTGGEDGTLRFEQCRRCAAYMHPPTGRCHACHSTDVAPAAVSGHGHVYSFTVNYQQWIPGSDPYVVVLVDLDEGTADEPLRLTSNLVGTDPADVTIGMPVEVCFLQRDDVWLPQFRAAAPS